MEKYEDKIAYVCKLFFTTEHKTKINCVPRISFNYL